MYFETGEGSALSAIVFYRLQRPPSSTLFPYTTLFRSAGKMPAELIPCGAGQCGTRPAGSISVERSEEHTSELQSLRHLVCRLLLEKKKNQSTSSSRAFAPPSNSPDAFPHAFNPIIRLK